jgi:hypothetical protein
MQASIPFSSVLEALGAIETAPVEISKNWDFHRVKFRTPAGNVTASYLCLAYDCPVGEATPENIVKWQSLGGGRHSYIVVVTTRSRHASDLTKTARQFHGRTATTPRALLLENVVSRFLPSGERLEEPKYFIEPDVARPNGIVQPALSYLVEALKNEQFGQTGQECAVMLVAPAGQGKTTLCRAVAKRLVNSDSQAIPILVESAQWQNLINLTLPNILNAALLQLVPDAGSLTNSKTFQLLIREQLLVPIFDGFDPSSTVGALLRLGNPQKSAVFDSTWSKT